MNHLFVIGMPGSGKSYLGQLLAQKLQRNFIDLDESIISFTGQAISALFEQSEGHFRNQEQSVLKHILQENQQAVVLAVGGGTPAFFDNLELMKSYGTLLWLDVPLAILLKNTQQDRGSRPLLQHSAIERTKTLEEMYTARLPYYAQADWKLNSTDMAALDNFVNTYHQFLLRNHG